MMVRACWCLIAAMALRGEVLTLADAEARAIRQHPRIAVARAAERVAAAGPGQVRARLGPQVDATVTGSIAEHGTRMGVGGINAPDLFSRLGAGIGISQLVTDFGRTKLIAESLDAQVAARGEGVKGVAAEVRLQVRTAYARALAGRAAVAVATETVKGRESILRQARALSESQLRSTLDAGFAEVRVAEAELLVTRSRNEAKSAMISLAQAMGEATTGDWELVEPEGAKLSGDVAALVQESLASRPEVAALRHSVESARRQAASDRKLALPTVTASGVAGGIVVGDPRLRPRYLGVGLNLNVPLWNGHAFDYRREESGGRLAQAESELKELELRIAGAVQQAHLEWETAESNIAVTRRLEEQSVRTLRLAEERYRAGLGTVVEYNQAQLDVAVARLAQAGARFEVLVRAAMVEFATGRLAR